MNLTKELELGQLCRICSVDVSNDTGQHFLFENNVITDLGEIFISCLGIQLMKDGYPDRVCDYCHLQLNTFHAFVKKAKTTSDQFAKIIEDAIRVDLMEDAKPDLEPDLEPESISITAMEFDIKPEQSIATNANSLEATLDIIVNNENDDSIETQEIESDNEYYTVEYLDAEYMSNFEDEISHIEDDSPTKKSNTNSKSKTLTSVKDARKRTYPFKCKKCSKRFVYKEVYEAHIRVHKGLPAFSCPHCPKTFKEKANFDYHMQDHTNYRPEKCPFEGCDKSFKNKQDLASHIRVHKDIRKYECDFPGCGKRFRSQSHMTYHRYAHFPERNFACDHPGCNQAFKSPHILRTHKNTVHSDIFRYECHCGRKFKRDHHLVAHKKTHTRVGRKTKAKNAKQTSYEVVEFVKEEEQFNVEYTDDQYEAEFITADVIEQ